MIFSEPMARLILEGRKTQTRRIYREQDVRVVRHHRRTSLIRPFRPVAGRSYAVQLGRGKPEEFRINCTAVRRERLGAIADSHDDVVAEGFRNLFAFASYWLSLHDKGWPRLEKVWCPDCLGDPECEANELSACTTCDGAEEIKIRPIPTSTELVSRFLHEHGHRHVWVITFAVERLAAQTYLAAKPGQIQSDYTRSPGQAAQEDGPVIVTHLPDPHQHVDLAPSTARQAAVAVEPSHLTAWADDAAAAHQERYDERVALDQRLLTFEDRITRARSKAQRAGVRIHSELRLLERLLDASKLDSDAIERGVRKLETKVDPRPQLVSHAA